VKRLTIRNREGQALIEFALVLPLLFLLIVNVVNFSGMLYAWITVSNAARTGSQYLMMGSATVHSPGRASFATIVSRVTADLVGLPNFATATIKVCTNNNGTITCNISGGVNPPNDPENSGPVGTYLVGSVDVTYNYTPLISAFSFPRLGIFLTTPPTSIHRQAVMRLA
jgi:Flp pilus assembly protein TadG